MSHRTPFPPADTATILAQLHASYGWQDVLSLNEELADGAESADGIIEECAKFATGVLEDLNGSMDAVGAKVVDGRVKTVPGHKDAWDQLAEGGWIALGHPAQYGGHEVPLSVWAAMQALMDRSCMAMMLPALMISASKLIHAWAEQDIKEEWLPKIAAGEWGATICLSEPDAGSDLGAIRTKAVKDENGDWRISGEKIWITYGDHDLTDRIGHCVLARDPDLPQGSAGLSLFLVPTKLEGEPDRNGVFTRRVEDKMGLKGSPTCAIGFENAKGFLMGQPGRGLSQMFVMITNMRLAVAIHGLGLASGATDTAWEYAAERRQGGKPGSPVPIIQHADVKRMLLDMRGRTEALRALIFAQANVVDIAAHTKDAEQKAEAEALASWLLPIVKTAGGEAAFDVSSIGVQVLGGAGYTKEWPIEQNVRDARVLPVFEGTTGMQALDLVHRRVLKGDGEGLRAFLRVAREAAAASPVEEARNLSAALDLLEDGAARMRELSPADANAGATEFLSLAIATAQGWVAARLTVADIEGETGEKLKEAARFVLSNVERLSRFHLDGALMGAARLGATA